MYEDYPAPADLEKRRLSTLEFGHMMELEGW